MEYNLTYMKENERITFIFSEIIFTYLIPFIQGCWNACDGTIQLDILTQIDFFLHRIYFSSWRTCNQEMIEISLITNIHTIARKGGECGDC